MPRTNARPVRRALRAATTAVGLGVVVNGLRLRGRAGGLRRLPAGAPTGPGPDQAVDLDGWRCIAADRVEVRPETFAAAVAWATDEGLDAVDLIPGDLQVERALDLLRQFEPATFRADPLQGGRTAGHALVVRAALARRADLPDGPVSPAELIEVARQVKRFAPRATDLVVAPDERSIDQTAGEQLAVKRTLFDRYDAVNLGTTGSELAVLGAGAVATPVVGLPALAAHHAQPALVLLGNPAGLAPRDLAWRTVARWVQEVVRLTGLVRADAPPPASIRLADELRPGYAKELAHGTDHLFEPRAEECPWCGGDDLRPRLTSPDLLQHKPGTFTLDECGSCGHLFQNPRLTVDGLDLYYRDFYDGFAGSEMEMVFAFETGEYEGRASMVAAHAAAPTRWLDVGSGHAHFCLVARDHFPDTSFEGVDQSSAIDDAARRGWIDHAHRGLFPEVANELAGRFDVVSMLHYLEHTRDPRAELDAAVTALAPGGLLMIELPDPESPSGQRLGRYWMPWFQPQHQHFVTIDRLEEELVERGLTVVDRYRSPATPGPDALVAAWLAAGEVVPRPWMPWRPRPTVAERAVRMAVVTAAAPVAIAAAVASQASAAVTGAGAPGNAFRVLARSDGAAPA